MSFYVVEYVPDIGIGFILAFCETMEDANKIADENRYPGREDEVLVWAATTETYDEYKQRNA